MARDHGVQIGFVRTAAAELRLEPGLPVWLAVKATEATEVAVHQVPEHTGHS